MKIERSALKKKLIQLSMHIAAYFLAAGRLAAAGFLMLLDGCLAAAGFLLLRAGRLAADCFLMLRAGRLAADCFLMLPAGRLATGGTGASTDTVKVAEAEIEAAG